MSEVEILLHFAASADRRASKLEAAWFDAALSPVAGNDLNPEQLKLQWARARRARERANELLQEAIAQHGL